MCKNRSALHMKAEFTQLCCNTKTVSIEEDHHCKNRLGMDTQIMDASNIYSGRPKKNRLQVWKKMDSACI